MMFFEMSLLAVLATGVKAIDNGIGLTPPMGWRSWNAYGGNVNQSLMEKVMDKMTERTRKIDGKDGMFSLLDLGYVNAGLDDNWQACGKGVDGSFHAADGTPLVNPESFPDMKKMTDYGHAKGLRVGWYMNNCICAEKNFKNDTYIKMHMEKSAAAIASYGFDGVKLDGCGQFRNLTWWSELINATGRPVMIENCHWGGTVPGPSHDAPCDGTKGISDCPYNFFRTSGDIRNSYDSMMSNLQTTRKYQGNPPTSRPGTWAYPDMLEVGRLANTNEDRAHFAAWCIVSAPLILGHDLTDDATTDRIWPIISNWEAIAINQAWYGHPGSLLSETDSVQIWQKPLSANKKAVLFLSKTTDSSSATVKFSDLGVEDGVDVDVHDVWTHKSVPNSAKDSFTSTVNGHDGNFYVVSWKGKNTMTKEMKFMPHFHKGRHGKKFHRHGHKGRRKHGKRHRHRHRHRHRAGRKHGDHKHGHKEHRFHKKGAHNGQRPQEQAA